MKITLRLVSFTVGFTALALTGALAQSPGVPEAPIIQLFGIFDYPGTGIQTRPQKISDVGDVVGIFVDPSGVSRGFIRFRNGNFSIPIVDPNDTGNVTEGRGINTSRLVCGDYLDATSGTFHGFFFSNNTFQNYDVPDSTTTIVLGVNNAGDFCGSATPTGGIQEAFLNIGGTVTEFAVTDATATLAYSLNANNQSCGYYIDPSGVTTHGFWRDNDGTIHAPIDPVGSTSTILFGNTVLRIKQHRRHDLNLMVGRYTDAAGATHGILFSPAHGFVVYDFPGATFTSLNGINELGRVVGRYTDPSTGIDHGILAKVQNGHAGVMLPLAPPSAPTQASPQRAVIVEPAY
jgi:hypothetical protein